MKSNTVKIVVFIISLFIIVTVGSQIYFSLTNKQETEEATYISVKDSVSLKGIFVRNETPIPFNGQGVINYVSPDGSKFATNSVVAEVYSSEQQIEAINKIADLNNEIKQLQRVINPGTTSVAQPEFISKQIDENYLEIENYIEHKNFDKVSSTKQDTLVLMNILNLVTNVEDKSKFEQRIADINAEITRLSANVSKPISYVTTAKPGYFVSYVDGYEDKLNFKTISKLTPDEINQITSATISSQNNAVGKIIDSYKWKMVGIINAEGRILKESDVKLSVPGVAELIPAHIDSAERIDDNNNYKIIISCNRLNYNLVQNRVEKIDIVFNEYSGVKVPRSAINFKNNVRGVYVALGQNKVFKKLDVIYEGSDYIISKNTSDSEYINLYDQIIFEEEDSFD